MIHATNAERTIILVAILFFGLTGFSPAQTADKKSSPTTPDLTSAIDPGIEAGDNLISNFHQVDDRLFRGGQPRSKGGIAKLAELGINTVVNLRDADENSIAEGQLVHSLGMRYFNIPLKRLGRPSDDDVAQVLAIINSPENGKVFIHCARGADRTGTIVALYRILRYNWTSELAEKEANQYGMRFWQRGMKNYIHDYASKRSNH